MKYLILLAILLAQSQFMLAQRRTDTPKYVMRPVIDSVRILSSEMKSPLQIKWEEQTMSGANATVENVTVGFFTTGKGAEMYAFHTTAPRGTIMKVRNLNNDQVVYVKVLGPLPQTKQFRGCALGLSNNARTVLGVRDTKALCEISYLAY